MHGGTVIGVLIAGVAQSLFAFLSVIKANRLPFLNSPGPRVPYARSEKPPVGSNKILTLNL